MKRETTDKGKSEVETYKMDVSSQCPLVSSRFDECYCKNMNSQKIANVVHYCMRNFETCEIYKAKKALKRADEARPVKLRIAKPQPLGVE